jgi:hypothetical protein
VPADAAPAPTPLPPSAPAAAAPKFASCASDKEGGTAMAAAAAAICAASEDGIPLAPAAPAPAPPPPLLEPATAGAGERAAAGAVPAAPAATPMAAGDAPRVTAACSCVTVLRSWMFSRLSHLHTWPGTAHGGGLSSVAWRAAGTRPGAGTAGSVQLVVTLRRGPCPGAAGLPAGLSPAAPPHSRVLRNGLLPLVCEVLQLQQHVGARPGEALHLRQQRLVLSRQPLGLAWHGGWVREGIG